MEEEDKKTSRWAESLGEAGLLDEIEDSWSLPPDSPIGGSTITVDGSARDEDGADTASTAEAKPPMARPTRPAIKRERPNPPPSPPAKPSNMPGIKQTMSGIPTAPTKPPTATATAEPLLVELESIEEQIEQPLIELELVEEEPGGALIELEAEPEDGPTTSAFDPDTAAVVSVRGARISVPPDRPESQEEPQPEIIDQPPPPAEPEKPARQLIGERYELGDYSGALEIAEQLLQQDPDDVEAADYAESCKEVLTQMYEARIGSFERVPQVAVSEHELIWRDLDPAAGFVLSRIDGFSTFEDIIDISGMPRFETCRILDQLLQEGIIK